mmetsp:Transcript_5139/g.12366  ORF Transcript_5139/g.12366 Transcript_5139/m.12366 type:complete len:210 (+) Transcript_5139:410-1039(+)
MPRIAPATRPSASTGARSAFVTTRMRRATPTRRSVGQTTRRRRCQTRWSPHSSSRPATACACCGTTMRPSPPIHSWPRRTMRRRGRWGCAEMSGWTTFRKWASNSRSPWRRHSSAGGDWRLGSPGWRLDLLPSSWRRWRRMGWTEGGTMRRIPSLGSLSASCSSRGTRRSSTSRTGPSRTQGRQPTSPPSPSGGASLTCTLRRWRGCHR